MGEKIDRHMVCKVVGGGDVRLDGQEGWLITGLQYIIGCGSKEYSFR